MQELVGDIQDFESLHQFVHQSLCESENLLTDQFRTQVLPLCSAEKICAVEFSLLGPRSLRLAAIWAVEQNVLYFYNASGERSRKVKLTSRISTEQLTGDQAA